MKYHPKEVYYKVKDGIASVVLDYGENKTEHIIAAQHRVQPTAFGGWVAVAFLVGIIVGLLAACFGGG